MDVVAVPVERRTPGYAGTGEETIIGSNGLRSVKVAVVIMSISLAGCSVDSEDLWPFSSDEPATPAPAPVSTGAPPPPQFADQASAPAPMTSVRVRRSGTLVGQRVSSLRSELDRLNERLDGQNERLIQIRRATVENAQRYHGTVAAVTSRLQLGTTPGNPVLVSQWNAAQAELDRVNGDILALNTLANDVASNSALANYVLESARAAYGLTGAIDEDHRQLAILEDDTNRTAVLVDRLLGEINEDISRQSAYVSTERANLTTLSQAVKNGELFGSNLAIRSAYGGGGRQAFASSSTPRGGFVSSGRRPLVVIRFDRPDVPYERALYSAVSRALQNQPAANFDVVAVTPSAGKAAQVALNQSRSKRFANRVMKSLTEMGMPASRVSLAATTSPGASTSEVHVFIR